MFGEYVLYELTLIDVDTGEFIDQLWLSAWGGKRFHKPTWLDDLFIEAHTSAFFVDIETGEAYEDWDEGDLQYRNEWVTAKDIEKIIANFKPLQTFIVVYKMIGFTDKHSGIYRQKPDITASKTRGYIGQLRTV